MKTLIFDIETDGLYDDVTRCWCICIRDPAKGDTRKYWMGHDLGGTRGDGIAKHGDIIDGVNELRTADRIVGHNIIGYDIPVLNKLFGFKPQGQVVDTLVLSRLFSPDREGGHSLRTWGEKLGYPKGDYEDWTGGLTEEMLEYCAKDVGVTLSLYTHLKNEIKGQSWGESIELEHSIAAIMSEQEVNGVEFDLELASDTIANLNNRLAEIDTHLKLSSIPVYCKTTGTLVSKPYTATGKMSVRASKIIGDSDTVVLGPMTKVEYSTVDLDSIHQVKKWLLSIGWVPTETTDKGSGKLTEDSFSSLSDSTIGTLLSERVQIRHRLGQILGWLKHVRSDGRISAQANPMGTPTGRMRHMKVVNVPSAATYPKEHELAGQLHWYTPGEKQSVLMGTEMRAMFKAKPGYVIVGHDASGLELRMLAHYMNDDAYTEILLNGDIHSYNQELAGLHTRAAAKTFIYAFIYGAGDAKLGDIVEGGESEGAELRASFLRENPKLNRLINKVKRRARERGYLVGLDGRRIYLRRGSNGRVLEHKALNTLLQCAGAVVMKKSMELLNKWAVEEELDFKKVIDMHDEGQAEVHVDHAERYAELARLSVIEAGKHFELNIPLDAEAKIGMNWAETH